jgi:flavin-dependent dehydrogenase
VANAEKEFDVIVVGGGPAGASAAIHLARGGGARVALVEQKKFPRAKLCGEFISPECLEHFARLGVAESMNGAGGVSLRETVFYASSGRAVAVPSEWFARGVASSSSGALGLSRAEMDARLLARAREVGATVFEEAHAAGVVFDSGGRVRGVRVQTQGTELSLRAPLTIDATGRARAVARRVERVAREDHRDVRAAREDRRGGNVSSFDDEVDVASNGNRRRELVAFKAHLSGARVAAGACEIYFYKGGYGGLSGVERGLSNLCFIVAARDVRARGSDAARVMREVVASNRRAAETLKDARVESAWLAVALEGFGRFGVAPASGLLAVGDAASFIDPFTGSGMLMALESGELAATTVARYLARLREKISPDDAHGNSFDAYSNSFDVHGDSFDAQGHYFDALAGEYRRLYRERFGARLRVCSYLRRAAFAPRALVELGIGALGASAHVRRALARATRGGSAGAAGE